MWVLRVVRDEGSVVVEVVLLCLALLFIVVGSPLRPVVALALVAVGTGVSYLWWSSRAREVDATLVPWLRAVAIGVGGGLAPADVVDTVNDSLALPPEQGRLSRCEADPVLARSLELWSSKRRAVSQFLMAAARWQAEQADHKAQALDARTSTAHAFLLVPLFSLLALAWQKVWIADPILLSRPPVARLLTVVVILWACGFCVRMWWRSRMIRGSPLAWSHHELAWDLYSVALEPVTAAGTLPTRHGAYLTRAEVELAQDVAHGTKGDEGREAATLALANHHLTQAISLLSKDLHLSGWSLVQVYAMYAPLLLASIVGPPFFRGCEVLDRVR